MEQPSVEERTGLPAWVRITLIVVGVLVALMVVVMAVGGGEHGPGRHMELPLVQAASALMRV